MNLELEVNAQRRESPVLSGRGGAGWAGEVVQASKEVCEAALAHVEPDRTVASYARTDFFEPRVSLMQQWADYVLPGYAGAGGG